MLQQVQNLSGPTPIRDNTFNVSYSKKGKLKSLSRIHDTCHA